MTHRVFVPGRIEVLGKHTDYGGGSSLLTAVDRGFTFRARAIEGDEVVIRADDRDEEVRWRVPRDGRAAVESVYPDPESRPSWARYADGVLDRVAATWDDGLSGVELRFTSDLPVAAGLSSSSALVTGVFLALDAALDLLDRPEGRAALPDRESLATWLSAAEMGGPVGMRGGSEDHTAILCAEEGRVVRYGLAPVRYRGSAPVPDGWTFVVGASGVVADKGGAVKEHYNRLSDLLAEAARVWAAGASDAEREALDLGDRSPNLGDALRVSSREATLDRIRESAAEQGRDGPEALVQRARHFLLETGFVDEAFTAREAGDVQAFADAANRSAHVGAELLENQVPETLGLARSARELGAIAASPFGAGFGGSVWALVPETDADRFPARWRMRYLDAFPGRTNATFFVAPASRPAHER